VPCTRYEDRDGVEWELFIPTIFAHKRWLDQGCDLVRRYMVEFKKTADPVYVHKIAVILDQAADTYYGLPLASHHRLCGGRDGGPLTRTEWEAVPRPAIFEVSYLGPWSKRKPYASPGWLNMMDEHIWVEPFARVRHHPAFKAVSRRLYGDPDALDRKIMHKLMRELSLMFQSVFSQKLLHNYQEALYTDLWLLGVLLQDKVLIDFAGPCQELTMYNHTYQDGMNGEGAPNYQAMPGGYYYPVLKDPDGWLQYQPDFLERNPFYWAAAGEMRKSQTVRGLHLEWGDQHEHVFAPGFITDPAKVREREEIGSRNWPGYGVGLIRVGGPGHRQEIGLGYTRASLHNAADALSLECWVDGVPVMRRGGYAAYWCNARLQWDRPEFQALREMAYPSEIEDATAADGFASWSWNWAHSPQNQNGLTVDEVATGKGWGDNRGYGECVTFKGGEPAGTPGSEFQILEVLDHYSWQRVDKDVKRWRRVIIGVEGPDGRPYALDMMHVTGGRRHVLYNQAWAERADADLPDPSGRAENLAHILFGDPLPEKTPQAEMAALIRKVELATPDSDTYGVTWTQDYGACGPHDPGGRPYNRPIPEDVGKVCLRFIGINQGDGRTELASGKGPWIAWLRQPLPAGQRVNGNVSLVDARDFCVEMRSGDGPLTSEFIHVLEGYRQGENSVIESVRRIVPTNMDGPERDIVALQLRFTAGHTDTVVYQSGTGMLALPDGVRTDARFALVRRGNDGQVAAVHAVRGKVLTCGEFSLSMPGTLGGTIVDVIGDLTGTRQESALIVRPDSPWPEGANLRDRQLNVRLESTLRAPCDEGYRVAATTPLPDGLIRVDVQDHAPFAVSWHEVTELPADRPNVIRTWRPMVDHGNSPWYNGLRIWFPERQQTYTIRTVNEVGGGHGGDTVELVEQVNLREQGIRPGDWYVIHGIRPGLRVSVANDAAWRRGAAPNWQQAVLRATGPVRLADPMLAAGAAFRSGTGAWQTVPAGAPLRVPSADAGVTHVVAGTPDWLNLQDNAAPAVTRIELDGRVLTPETAADLGVIQPPKRAVISLRDETNPLDRESLVVSLNGGPITPDTALNVRFDADGQAVQVVVELTAATADDRYRSRRHTLTVTAADRSVEKHSTSASVSYVTEAPREPGAVYLSDLKAASSFAHGGAKINTDYGGNEATLGDRIYRRSIMICPEPSAEGAHGEIVFELPPDAPRVFRSDIGIEDMAEGRGTVVFMVQRGTAADGPWETLYTSPTMRGTSEPLSPQVDLGNARFLRLYTTDAGDSINSDHALWGDPRLVQPRNVR
jgi:hypothetical protein